MCVVSMVMDHYHEKWDKITPVQPSVPSPITPEEIKESAG